MTMMVGFEVLLTQLSYKEPCGRAGSTGGGRWSSGIPRADFPTRTRAKNINLRPFFSGQGFV